MKKIISSMILVVVIIFTIGITQNENKSIQTISTIEQKSLEVSKKQNSKKIIVIDAGHQKRANTKLEPIGPDARTKKYKVTGGATGKYTGQTEYNLNLKVAKQLQKKLKEKGYKVIMIRTSNNVNISNSQRAKIANKAKADVFIRIHANSATSSKANGVLTMCQTKNNKYNKKLYKKSYKLSKTILKNVVKKTGAKNLGVTKTDTMSGINWAQVPTTILEMGFLSNKKEDKLLAKSSYQKKIVNGIVKGIEEYLK